MDPRQYLNSLRRGLRALALLNKRGTLKVSQLAQELGVPRTTAHRILETLKIDGYVEHVAHERLYRLAPMVNMLSGGFSDESWISHVASPLLFEKTKEIGWPLTISTPLGDEVVVRISTDHASPLALEHFHIGFKAPMMHATSGHVILAFASKVYRDLLLDLIRKSGNPKQAISREPSIVNYMLNKVQLQGYAHVVYDEYSEASIGVPIFSGGEVKACLLMGYIKTALTEDQVAARYLPTLLALARRIEEDVKASKARADIQ